jgi:hypothetical protein
MIQHDKKDIVIEAFKALINSIMAYSLNKLVGNDTNDAASENNGTEVITKIMTVMTSLLDSQVSLK